MSANNCFISVCELLVDSEAPPDVGRAHYWCERAERLFPHHPTVFRLKEQLLTADGEEDAAELEALIACKLKLHKLVLCKIEKTASVV
jgi:hypothetical protein